MSEKFEKQRAPRNKTLSLSDNDFTKLKKRLIKVDKTVALNEIENKTIHQNVFETLDYLPNSFVDLIFVDPPYNLTKTFNSNSFKEMESEEYEQWLDSWLSKLIR